MSLRTAAKSPLGLIAAVVLFCFGLVESVSQALCFKASSLTDTCQAKIYGLQSGERSGEDIYLEKIEQWQDGPQL